jgi:hypothetical protein
MWPSCVTLGAEFNKTVQRLRNLWTLRPTIQPTMTRPTRFDDAPARAVCEKVGCYDAANHSATLKSPHPEFTGDKKRGYSLTNPGIKRGADFVRQIASIAR